MGAREVSVIVVSRGRPRELTLCLTALGQQLFHPFEVVVVTDLAGIAAATAHPLGANLRHVALEDPNIDDASKD